MMPSRSRLRWLIPLVFLMVASVVMLALYSDKDLQPEPANEKTAVPAALKTPDAAQTNHNILGTIGEEQNTGETQITSKDNNPLTGTGTLDLPDTDAISFLKSLMALTFVLGLIFLAAYFFKKITGMKGTGMRTNRVPIHMVGHLPLGEKKFLSIVEIQDKHYFIGITPSNINMLSQLELELPEEQLKQDSDGDFENIFKKARALLQKGKN